MPMCLKIHEISTCTEVKGPKQISVNYLQTKAAAVVGSIRHTPRLSMLQPEVPWLVLLLVEDQLTPLRPTGAIDQNANRKTFGVRREAPYTSGLSRDIFQRPPPG